MTEVAGAWETMPYLVQMAAKGDLIIYTNTDPSAQLCRRDVVNNADLLGPLIAALGRLFALSAPPPTACQGLRPTIKEIEKHVDDFFWRARPRGKPPVDGPLSISIS